ncbi:MAG: PKD domain-containing protein [Euryarchaeota archaeon]|nr:PKD domain-containing protein [Euryarchaeota archaeon]
MDDNAPNPCGCAPPDTTNSVGAGYVVEMANTASEMWTTSGTVAQPSTPLTTLFGTSDSLSDPQVQYDPISGRWFAEILSVTTFGNVFFAVSQTSNPTGSWYQYSVSMPITGDLPDQCVIGVDANTVVLSGNDFAGGSSFVGAVFFVINKTQAVAGSAPTYAVDGPGSTSYASIHPARELSLSNTIYMVGRGNNVGGSPTTLVYMTITGAPPSAFTFTYQNITTTGSMPGGAPQPGGSVNVDDERVVTATWLNGNFWAAANEGTCTGGDAVCLHLWEFTATGPTATVVNDFIWSPAGGLSGYYPAVTLSLSGNLGVVYSFSDASTYPSVAITGWSPSDGTNLEAPTVVHPGTSNELAGRFGDYSGAATDTSTNIFWVSGEYITPASYWNTWVQSFSMPGFIANSLVTPNPVDVGVPVYFNGTASGGTAPFTFRWVYGDGGPTSSARNPSHIYNATCSCAGHFWINETSGLLRSREANFTVTVNALPTATLRATPNPTDVGINATFTSVVTGGTSPFAYAWSFGDGFQSTSASPVHQYSAAGTYAAQLWVNDSGGGSGHVTGSIVVNPQPSITFSATPVPVDAGVGVVLTSSIAGGTGLVNITWVLGDGNVATGPTVAHTYALRGNYTVRAWANDSIGGTGNSTQVIVVNPYLALLLVSASPLVLDVGRPVTFGASYWGGTASYTYEWRFGDGTTAATISPVHAFLSAGSPLVRFWLNDSGGGSATAQVSITVNPALTISSFQGSWTGGARNALDKGQTVSLSASVTGGTGSYSYLYSGLPTGCTSWNFATISCAPNETGNFTVELKVTDQNGASAFSNTTFVVNPPLSVGSFWASPAIDTVNGPTTLTVVAVHGTPGYRYSFPILPPGCSISTNASVSCSPTTVGTNSAEVRVTDAVGVNAFANTTFLVNPSPQVLSFVATPSTVTAGDLVSFTVTASGGTAPYSYAYTGLPSGCSLSGNGGSCHPSSTGKFTVQVTVTDSNGQKGTAVTTVTVNAPPGIFAGGLYSFGFLWTLLALLAIVVLVFVILVLRRYRALKGQTPTYAPGGGAATTSYESTDHSVAPSPEGHAFPNEPAPTSEQTQPGFAPPPPPPSSSSPPPPPPPPPPSGTGGMGGWPQ